MTYPVHDGGPPLHGDALEHGQHGMDDVVEGGDPVVGPLPLLQAHALVRPELKEHHITAPLFYLCVHCIKMVISTADAEIKLSKLFHYVSQPQHLTQWDAENQNYINYIRIIMI